MYRAVFEIRSLKVSGSIPVYDFTFRPDLPVEIYRSRATLDLHNFLRQIVLSEKKMFEDERMALVNRSTRAARLIN